MKRLQFKLYASLCDYLPERAENNSIDIEVDDGATPLSILEKYRVPLDRAHLILLNGVYLGAAERSRALFKSGDTLAVWPPVAGG